MRDLVIAALILGLLPVALLRPYYGLLIWCWIAYMVPHKLGWGMTSHWPVAAAAGGLFLIGYMLSKEPKKLPITPIVTVHLLLVFWWLLTFLMNDRPEQAWVQFDKVWKIQLFTFITIIIINTRERLTQLVAVIALSIAFFGVKGGLFTILTGGGSRVWGPSGGFFEGNNELGLTLLTVLPLLRFLQLQTQKKWQHWALSGAMVLCLVAAIGTHSRGALLAAIVMGAYFWWKSPHKVPITVALVILVPLLYTFLPKNWHDRMATMKVDFKTVEVTRPVDTSTLCGSLTAKMQAADSSFGGRVNAWCFALNLASHNLFGGGFSAFSPENFSRHAPDPSDFHDAHSIYFKILGDHGFIGFFLFLLLLAMAWRETQQISRISNLRGDKWSLQLADMLQISLLAFCTGGLFLGLCYFDLLYHLIAMVIVLGILVRREPATVNTTVQKRRFASSLPGNSTSL